LASDFSSGMLFNFLLAIASLSRCTSFSGNCTIVRADAGGVGAGGVGAPGSGADEALALASLIRCTACCCITIGLRPPNVIVGIDNDTGLSNPGNDDDELVLDNDLEDADDDTLLSRSDKSSSNPLNRNPRSGEPGGLALGDKSMSNGLDCPDDKLYADGLVVIGTNAEDDERINPNSSGFCGATLLTNASNIFGGSLFEMFSAPNSFFIISLSLIIPGGVDSGC
jgi:hypothetical protein